jgi:chorismate--pyruvate lyase
MQLIPPRHSDWHDVPSPSYTRQQKHWLFRPGALTAGLRQLGAVELRVAREFSQGLSTAEAWMLDLPPRSPVWVREIIMSVHGVDSVFARSFTPLRASHGWWQGMRSLRTRPLADMLYHDPQILRSPFVACRIRRQNPLYGTALRILGDDCPAPAKILARASVFWRHGQPLLVAEGFLPAFWSVAAKAAYDLGLGVESI